MYRSASRHLQGSIEGWLNHAPSKQTEPLSWRVVIDFAGKRAASPKSYTRPDASYLKSRVIQKCRGRGVDVTISQRQVRETADWFTVLAAIENAPRTNIDRAAPQEIDRQTKMQRQTSAWTTRIRDGVECPRCEAKRGEYCIDRHGRPLLTLHRRRHNLYLLKPAEIAPPDTESATLPHNSRRGFGRGMSEAQRRTY